MSAVAIIVPVFKAEKCLCRCVDSILAQTFKNFSLILVDDGSPDRSPAICDQYAEQDSRVTVIHQQNCGVAAARNAGLDWVMDNSDCQWITFIDSDDWVHPQYLETLVDTALKFDAAVSICGFTETDGEEPVLADADLSASIWSTEEFFLTNNNIATVPWGKLYRRSCFEGIRYPVGKIHEDEFVTYRILFREPTVVAVSAPLYFYYKNPGGITKGLWTPARLDLLEAIDQQLVYFEERQISSMMKKRLKVGLVSMRMQLEEIRKASQMTGCQYAKYERQIRRHMRYLMFRYRSLHVTRLSTDPWVYEGVAPNFMKLYWRVKRIFE